MIYESFYWKQPLLKMADRIEKYAVRGKLTARQAAQYERDMFLGFYTVRKLFESSMKVSDETRAMTMSLRWYPKRPEAPVADWYNRAEFWNLYDMEGECDEVRDALFVAHRIIHSFIFIGSAGGDGRPSGDLFNSDRDKDVRLYFVPTAEVLRLLRAVAMDYPDVQSWYDEGSGERKWRALPRGTITPER